MSYFRLSSTTLIALAFSASWGCRSQSAISQDEVAVKALGALPYVSDGEFRLGATDRMFLIEDKSDFYRYSQIIPELPKINFGTQSILVVMSWKSTSRSLQFVRQDGQHLVIGVKQELPPRFYAGSYRSPDLLVFVLPAWTGPVRFEVNGKEAFTVLRGDALETRVGELWDEIIRIHSGGSQTQEQLLRYCRKMWPRATESEVRIGAEKMQKKRAIDPRLLYNILFRDLRNYPEMLNLFFPS